MIKWNSTRLLQPYLNEEPKAGAYIN